MPKDLEENSEMAHIKWLYMKPAAAEPGFVVKDCVFSICVLPSVPICVVGQIITGNMDNYK